MTSGGFPVAPETLRDMAMASAPTNDEIRDDYMHGKVSHALVGMGLAHCWRCLRTTFSTYTSRSRYFGITELTNCCGAKVVTR